MDEDTRDLIRQLCTRAGMIMEDASLLAINMPAQFGPLAAGRAADALGLGAPLWIMVGLTFVAGLLAFGLRQDNGHARAALQELETDARTIGSLIAAANELARRCGP